MPNHNVDVSKRPGYSTTTATLKPFRHDASSQLSKGTKVSASWLEDFAISPSDTYEVRIAWRHLKLLDGEDRITEICEQLAHSSSEDEFRKLLRGCIEGSYHAAFYQLRLAFPHATLQKLTLQELKEVFRDSDYEPANMRSKMVTLFKGLCREAGINIVSDDNETPQEPNEPITETRQRMPLDEEVLDTLERYAPMQGPFPTNNDGQFSRNGYSEINAIIENLELLRQMSNSPTWSEANHDLWLKLLTNNVRQLENAIKEQKRKKQ